MTLHRRFISSCKKYGNRPAIFDESSGRVVSYKKLLLVSLILARRIQRWDEKNIGIMVPTSAGAIVAKIATLLAGKTPVMINYSTGANANCQMAIARTGVKHIFTSSQLLTKLGINPIPEMLFMEEVVSSISTTEKIAGLFYATFPQLFSDNAVDSDHAVILFTSGSEKEPKIVPLTHSNILANLNDIVSSLDFDTNDKFLSILPYFHVFGMTVNLWTPLLAGASIVTYPNPLDYKQVVNIIESKKPTILAATPTFIHGFFQRAQKDSFQSLRICVAGADKLPDELRKRAQKEFNLEILEGYGTTETSPVISVNLPNNNRYGSIGRPLPSVQIKIIGIEHDRELPRGEEGRILVKGPSVMSGYLNDEINTKSAFIDGWYNTGDIGILDSENFLWHRGRLKRFVKIGGEMVSLLVIENELSKLLPVEALCCVVAIPDPIKGSTIIATYTTNQNEEELRSKLAKLLSPLLLPKRFHQMESLPVMGSGKVNFREVEKIIANLSDG